MPNERLIGAPGQWDRMRRDFAWAIPETLNIAELCCDAWAERAPDRVAIRHVMSDGEVEEWTYGRLKAASDALAATLSGHGVGRGDRVAIFMAQNPRALVAHFAAMKLGAISLPLFTLFGSDALRYRLADSGSVALVADLGVLDIVMDLRADLPDLRLILSTGQPPSPVLSLDEAMEKGTIKRAPTLADDPAVMIYTSGTTGNPKGVLHAHRFLLGHLPCMELAQGDFPQQGDVGWTPADWAWIGGLMDMALPCLYYGVPLISHRFAKFDPEAAYALMVAEGVTNSFMPPTALRLMRDAAVPPGLQLRAIGSGGEALGTDLLDWGRDALGCPINEFYGQTEANLVVAACDGVMDRVPGAMGLPVPGHQVAVLGPDDAPVGTGETGEICVAAPNPVMMLRYWQKPEATAKKVRNGWLRTGDLATMRSDGQLVFNARDDDVITSAGYRIGPVEIEQALCRHPDVALAAVVGEPDPIRTEVVVAHVVLRDGAEVSDDALKALVRERVAAHLVPKRIVRAGKLPMTATGKILRRALRKG